MKRAAIAFAVLLLAAPASALPILPPSSHCGCHWEDIGPEPHVNPPDPGWDPALTLGEIAGLKAIDDAHEPMPEPTRYVEYCITPGQPKTPDVTSGGGGSTGGGGQPGGGSPVAEPSVLGLLAFGGGMAWLRRRGWTFLACTGFPHLCPGHGCAICRWVAEHEASR